MPQTDLIQRRDWDVLCILDACRYDIFKEVYEDYLDGILKKVISPASATKQWALATFDESFNDVIYISGTPFINSGGHVFPLAKDWFYKIYDAWKYHWDDDLGTVPPEKVTWEVLNALRRYPKRKIIAHYIQPHAPYLRTNSSGGGLDLVYDQAAGVTTHKFPRPYEGLIIYEKEGKEKLREAYRSNVEAVLEGIIPLTDRQEKIILTADHGEMLGEDGYLFHPFDVDHHLLREVPWFELAG